MELMGKIYGADGRNFVVKLIRTLWSVRIGVVTNFLGVRNSVTNSKLSESFCY